MEISILCHYCLDNRCTCGGCVQQLQSPWCECCIGNLIVSMSDTDSDVKPSALALLEGLIKSNLNQDVQEE